MLPQRYLAQIADYITERARQAAPMIGAAGASGGGGGGSGGFNGVGDPSAMAAASGKYYKCMYT